MNRLDEEYKSCKFKWNCENCDKTLCLRIAAISDFPTKYGHCGPQLSKSLQMIEKAGLGILLYMQQEGRGIGLTNKIRAYMASILPVFLATFSNNLKKTYPSTIDTEPTTSCGPRSDVMSSSGASAVRSQATTLQQSMKPRDSTRPQASLFDLYRHSQKR
jgi:hypothetical protein